VTAFISVARGFLRCLRTMARQQTISAKVVPLTERVLDHVMTTLLKNYNISSFVQQNWSTAKEQSGSDKINNPHFPIVFNKAQSGSTAAASKDHVSGYQITAQ
jgi:hypothetical protein